MLVQPDNLPELGADLVAALASLHMHDFSHGGCDETRGICRVQTEIYIILDIHFNTKSFVATALCHEDFDLKCGQSEFKQFKGVW